MHALIILLIMSILMFKPILSSSLIGRRSKPIVDFRFILNPYPLDHPKHDCLELVVNFQAF